MLQKSNGAAFADEADFVGQIETTISSWSEVKIEPKTDDELEENIDNLAADAEKPKLLRSDAAVIKDEIGFVDQTETDISIAKPEVKIEIETEVFTGEAKFKDRKYDFYMLTGNSELRDNLVKSENAEIKSEATNITAKRTMGNWKGRKETSTQRKRRLEKAKRKRIEKLARESSEERQIRLEQRRMYHQKYRARQSVEQRQARFESLRKYQAKARAVKLQKQ